MWARMNRHKLPDGAGGKSSWVSWIGLKLLLLRSLHQFCSYIIILTGVEKLDDDRNKKIYFVSFRLAFSSLRQTYRLNSRTIINNFYIENKQNETYISG